ncbi:LysR family transcriptional regulator [Hydrogenophaga sp.]|uniref:LysR family transcriptional regulator n=1 Tax=Hydrogenophaga sp. TaxID=1904254 RepID=UPI002609510B|nr:LysR family transcriptional regulator [Hydrogenophaga sp.]MCW5653591.1 LysR family transcriptional regulator [Hydrogenophaga sp.]
MFAPLMRYFVEVAREGSIRAAAEKLHIAASAINRHILEYEEQLGTPLFERLPRGMRLTQAGQILFDTAKRLQQDYNYAVSEVDQIRQAKRGHVSLATLHALAEDLLPPVIHELLQQHPAIRYSFVVRNSVEAVRLVSEDDIDLGLAYDPPPGAPLTVLHSAEMPTGVILPPTHALARHEEISLEQCAAFPIILQRSGEMRENITRMQREEGVPIEPVVETDSAAMFRELVMNGSGIGFVSLAAVLYELSTGQLVFRPLAGHKELHPRLCLFAKAGRQLPAVVRLLADRLIAAFPSPVAGTYPQLSRAIRGAGGGPASSQA